MSHMSACILKVHTDEGLTGIGEAQGPNVEDELKHKLGPFLKGQDPFNITRLIINMENRFGRSTIVAGLDFALHDIVGKALGTPVYQFLGGKFRERVPLVWNLPYVSIEEQVVEAKARVAEGFTHAVKMKVGVPGDLEHILAVAQVIGDVPLRPDANEGHNKQTALNQYREVLARGAKLELLEDPCPTSWDDYQELAEALAVGISVHAGLSSLHSVASLVQAAKPGIRCVNIMPSYWGIYRTAQIANALECAGIGWTMGTSHHSGVTIAASLHLGTAIHNHLYPADLLGPRLFVEDALQEPLYLKAGYGIAPSGPGLGIELDEEVLAKHLAAS